MEASSTEVPPFLMTVAYENLTQNNSQYSVLSSREGTSSSLSDLLFYSQGVGVFSNAI